eukprot:CAMPEP_0113666300 /NCGR_PEP_ID=MMETSP0038_2-20120614/2795_1 /TAXON_ID=2898 /ORGANISM="Cryptomonas paramecium" /LENGTH=256 /DNA_ID=CAMNT_0000581771 /DNA_START=12 /DNA_END=779 /DNA_ORIENTATION=+ /assembly_acc=CAM_ASM_000170
MNPARDILPFSPLAPSGANLLILLAIIMVFVWFCRILKILHRVYDLNVAITSGQIVRLQNGGIEFGEIEMLWRTNLQQQLLRARRITQAVPVREIHPQFVIKKDSIKFAEFSGQQAIGIDFIYTASTKVAVQIFWNVPSSALQAHVDRYNQEHIGRGGRGRHDSRRKKRLGGQRYMAVNDRETTGNAAASGAQRGVQERLGALLGTSDVAASVGSSFFADSECSCRSGVTVLDVAQDAAFGCPESSKVSMRALDMA